MSKSWEIVALKALDNWEMAAREYFLDLQFGIDSLNQSPETEEDYQEIFEFNRKLVKALVNRVTIDKRCEL